jgi:hypothetical protein
MKKKCFTCKTEKDLSEFPKDNHRNTGYHSSCKKCCYAKNKKWVENNRDKARQSNTNWYRNRGTIRINNITQAKDSDSFQQDCSNQNYTCAICHQPKKLVYDHDHHTGKYRGAICHACNHLLGHAYDNPQILQSAIGYLFYASLL